MKLKLGLIGLASGMVVACAVAAGLDDVVAPGTVAEKLADGFKFTEGATVNAAGEVFFVDQPNNKILRWSREQGLRTFMEPAGRANGMCFAPDGNLLVCADEKTELWSVTPDGKVTVLTKAHAGKALNGPNDVWACPEGGGCYFTDPFYKRPWWTHTDAPQDSQQVYFLPKGGTPRRVTDDLLQPNGIVGTPDGKHLYVADIKANKTFVYVIQSGTLAARLFCEKDRRHDNRCRRTDLSDPQRGLCLTRWEPGVIKSRRLDGQRLHRRPEKRHALCDRIEGILRRPTQGQGDAAGQVSHAGHVPSFSGQGATVVARGARTGVRLGTCLARRGGARTRTRGLLCLAGGTAYVAASGRSGAFADAGAHAAPVRLCAGTGRARGGASQDH